MHKDNIGIRDRVVLRLVMGDELGQQGGLVMVIVHKDSMGIKGCTLEFGFCYIYSVGFFFGCVVLFG
jgi:hypothetical protein